MIGELADLKRMQRDDLYQHYRKHYVPGNAVVALAGDFDSEEMLASVRQVYESIPAGTVPAADVPLEPPLQAEQRLEINGQGDTTYLRVAYRAPAAGDPDFFAFSV
ncbi:MAG: insulinase family protein, partial [Chloroflexi bacterium]|nr:insulinase family protein [Chloroflexota bacterium]